ncbi:hypothetical protein [uncultured Mucilaginibacter sp.]|uniref:hypothetical protein n=1 Tax=uncultured Mucilaginibacter sp. TaxID=797541 RepID=UPI0025DC122B|nr:hypothetical protein [uncultured Mucilaginibacter sp.]
MFDKHTDRKELNKQPFYFQPSRYELWIDGNLLNSGKTDHEIRATVISEHGEEKIKINFDDSKLHHEIKQFNVFDKFMTSNDRLQLITIPADTNADCVGLSMMQRLVGATRQEKNFDRNEPYCCNLFTINGIISKVTFSYSNPEKLLEFYPQESNLVLNFSFESSDHIRYENGIHVSGPHGGAKRVIKVSPNQTGGEGYSITIFDSIGNTQMSTKQMRITSTESSTIILKGFGNDEHGFTFSDYGLTIHHNDGQMIKCTLHLFDRNVIIDYLS